MKTTHIVLAVIIAATSAVQAATSEHKLPAPLPEFKTPEQLVKWSEEMTTKAAAADALAAKQANSAFKNVAAFFTGKPYVEETGSYAFRFRQYDPEFSRWTSADPSGFPDGANRYVLGGNPVSGLDQLGLWYDASYNSTHALADFLTASTEANSLGAAGFSNAESLADNSLSQAPVDDTGVGSWGNPATRLATSHEKDLLQNDGAFTKSFTTTLFEGQSANYSFTQLIDYGLTSDIGLSYGQVLYTVSGTITKQNNTYSTNPLFTFDDRYDFNVNNPATAAFARLQFHDIVYNYRVV